MKIIPIPLSFGVSETIYETNMGFKTADVNSAVLQFTSDTDPVGCVATLTMKNETDNANRVSSVLEQFDVTENSFSYFVGNEIQSEGIWLGDITLKRNLITVCSQKFRFAVGSSLQSTVITQLVKSKSLDELVLAIREDVMEHLGKSDASVETITAYLNGVIAKIILSENTRVVSETQRKLNETARGVTFTEWGEAVQNLIDQGIIDQRVQAIIEELQATYSTSLFSLSQQLADKVDVGGVEQVGLGMLTQAVKLGMTGGSVAVVGDDAVNLTNVVDKAINGGKCSFINTKQYNLYNEASTLLGYQISIGGTVSANAAAKLSDYIKVEPNTEYTGSGTDTRSMAFFDDAKQYVSGLAKAPSRGKYTFTVPTGCYYVRITYTITVSNIVVCETANYDGTYYPYNTEDIELKRVVNQFETKNIKNNAVTYEKADFITTGKNLLDSAKSSDYYLSASSGSVVSSVTYRLSEFIKVEPNTDYVISPSCRHFLAYDVDKKAITASYMGTNTTNYTFNSGDTYEYIRFDYYTNKESTTQLEKGVAPTGYERYGYEIPKLLIDENENVLKDNSILTIGDSIVTGDGNNGIGIGDILATRNGMTVTDYSKGGATVWYDDVDAASADEQVKRQNIQYQVDQAILNVTSPDFILFDGYANDISALAPLGEISDGYAAVLDKYTFSGGFEYCVKTLKTNFPTAKLIYIRVHNMGSRFYSNQLLYGNRAVEICEKWSVKVVDLFKECGLNTNLTEYQQYTNNADKTHPTQTGYDIFYMPLIETTMKSVVNV